MAAAFFALDSFAQVAGNQFPDQADTAAYTPKISWDRSSAMASAHSIDTRHAVNQLTVTGALGDGVATVAQLKTISARDDWPLPARELAIYQFTRSLATQPRHSVDLAILDFLTLYQPQVCEI